MHALREGIVPEPDRGVKLRVLRGRHCDCAGG